jgi:hypothetical protein
MPPFVVTAVAAAGIWHTAIQMFVAEKGFHRHGRDGEGDDRPDQKFNAENLGGML